MDKCSDSAAKKPCPGPKPELFSLYPLSFDEAVEILVKAKPKKNNNNAKKNKGAQKTTNRD